MFGIGLIAVIVVWAMFSLWIGRLLARWLLRLKKTPESTGNVLGNSLLSFVFTALVFVLPISDEIIVYPKYQALCEGADEFHFATGMNESNIRGKEIYTIHIEQRIMLFPDVHIMTKQEMQRRVNEHDVSGVIVDYSQRQYIDSQSGKVILNAHDVHPLSSLFAFPNAAGGRNTWLLSECGIDRNPNRDKQYAFYKALQLKQVEAPNQDNYRLKEE